MITSDVTKFIKTLDICNRNKGLNEINFNFKNVYKYSGKYQIRICYLKSGLKIVFKGTYSFRDNKFNIKGFKYDKI